MTGQAISTSHIDRFSSLPNELLDHIFDMVRFSNQYSHCCYGGSPLSKRLLPFYLRILHHSFSPGDWRHVRLLNEAIVRDPGITLRIKEVELYHLAGFKEAQDVLELASLLRQIPNVEQIGFYMETQDMAEIFWTELDANPTLFPKLCSLEMGFLNDSNSLPSGTTGLTPLRHLQNLTTLTACWPFESTILSVPTVQLPNLEYLRFRGEGCGDASNLALIQSCPSLHTVEFEEISMSHSLDQVIPGISPNLQDLSLPGHSDRPIDQYLSHLTGLRYLHLGHSSYDRNLAAHLSLLPFLKSLTLDPAQYDVVVVEELLNGPNCLQHLRCLTLEFTMGGKFDVRADPENLNWQADTRWEWAGYPSLRYSSHQLASLEASVVRARSQGIRLSGQVLLLREELENYLIELHNRAILHLASTADASKYLEAQSLSLEYDFPLPLLDLAHLDITQSRIVKVPIPQPDWYVLTLQ